jgi:hypothetical protein
MDKLNEIKNKYEYAPLSEMPNLDIWWLIREVDQLRAERAEHFLCHINTDQAVS